jgi:hypothetical protein
VTLCSDVVGYQRFGGPSYHITTPWRWRQHDPPKRWCPTTLYGITTQIISTWIFTAVITSNLAPWICPSLSVKDQVSHPYKVATAHP